MTFLEAKARAAAYTIINTYEEAFECKLPEHLKEYTKREWIENMKPIKIFIDSINEQYKEEILNG